jgi:hypothetical protein
MMHQLKSLRRPRIIQEKQSTENRPKPAKAMVDFCREIAACVELVVTVTVKVPEDPEVNDRVEGEIVQFAYWGVPLQVRPTAPL